MELEKFFQHMQLTNMQFIKFYREFLQLNKKDTQKKIGKEATKQDFFKRGNPHGQEAYVKNAQSHKKSEKCKLK